MRLNDYNSSISDDTVCGFQRADPITPFLTKIQL